MYEYFIFDLDGTIINSEQGVTRCTSYALKYFGIDEKPENLLHFIGPPLHYSFKKFYNFSDEQAATAVAKFRERYSEKGIFECSLYDGMKQSLEYLYNNGKKLAVATSKYEPFAVQILKNLGVDKYFSTVVGSSYGADFAQKKLIIGAVIEKLSAEKEKCVMVGDTQFDIIGANEAGIDSIAVSYGFGTAQEIESGNPTHIIDSPEKLRQFVRFGKINN